MMERLWDAKLHDSDTVTFRKRITERVVNQATKWEEVAKAEYRAEKGVHERMGWIVKSLEEKDEQRKKEQARLQQRPVRREGDTEGIG